MELLVEVLKWIALIFLAGAIGQFGKAVTQRILGRSRSPEPPATPPDRTDAAATKERAKAEKKRAKAAAKVLKKQR